MKLPYTDTGKTVVEAGLGAKGNQEFRFGHVKFEVLLDIQVESTMLRGAG